MDLRRAEGLVWFTVIFNAVAIVVGFAAVYLTPLVQFDIHLFTPWLFPGIFALPLALVLIGLTVWLSRKSRTAAVAIAVLYLLDRLFVVVWLYPFSVTFRIVWVIVAAVWLAGFVPGVIGTFAYHRLGD